MCWPGTALRRILVASWQKVTACSWNLNIVSQPASLLPHSLFPAKFCDPGISQEVAHACSPWLVLHESKKWLQFGGGARKWSSLEVAAQRFTVQGSHESLVLCSPGNAKVSEACSTLLVVHES